MPQVAENHLDIGELAGMLVEISGVNDMRIKVCQRGDALAPALSEHLALDR